MITRACAPCGTCRSTLDIEPEQDYIPILHDVLFSFAAHLARRARRLLASAGDVIVIRDCLRADEAAFKIAVNLSGSLRRRLAPMNRPGARFLRPSREKRL